MAGGGGWLPLELSLAIAGTSAAGAGAAPAPAGGRLQSRSAGRRTITSLYDELGALLPGRLPADRAASRDEIVDAAVAQVRALEDAAAALESYRHRAVTLARGAAWPRAARAAPPRPPEVAVAGATVCFSARLPVPAAGPGALTRVLEAFHRRGVQVLVATVARHGHGPARAAVVTVTAAAAPPEVVEMIRADIARIR